MHDPTTHTAQVTAPPAIAAGATYAGIMLWPFLVAMAAGAVALIYMGRMKPLNSLKSVLGSSLIGGSISQLTATPVLLIVGAKFPELQPWAVDAKIPMTALLAIIIGLICQKGIPALLNRVEREAGGQT